VRIYHLDHGAGYGGAERSLLELARSQAGLGHAPIVAVGRAGRLAEEADKAGLEVRVLDWPVRYVSVPQGAPAGGVVRVVPAFVRAATLLRRDLAACDPDIVHVHTRKAQLVAAIAARRLRPLLVWHLRDDPPERWIVRLVVRIAIRRADHAVTISRWMADAYRTAGIVPRSGRIGLIPSGVATDRLRGLPTPWLDGERPPIVGYIGQIARRKGPDLLVAAAERLDDRPDVTFRIIGDVAFPLAEGRFGEELAAAIRRSPIADRIQWVAASSSPEEAFAEIDVLVVPSRVPEPLGRVVVEAMASRRAVVAVGVGATLELVDASSATLVTGATGTAIADGIRAAVDDRDAARRRVDAAAPRAAAFDPTKIARRMDEEYQVAGR
jgi:glycosyltransferase involved in cell wall biosynthesis